ncbi:hypothetical protein PHYBOEH_004032 [Phytophthora boehmeriae]|uniref:Uncharacterized protein n=1 Tax=Phytophthora boehmeriae TaxID=109152 RepID=A0A8T1WMU8_9STRA|nr:hypothetical protein PHYBOEH_004032 [Phytophthora boehmeriae]
MRVATRQKRGLPAPSGAKKKKTTAQKRKHVQQLAKTSRWSEIERLYGKKILAKAKAYIEQKRVVKTPQEIALDVLRKNGYQPSVPQAPATTANTPAMSRPAGTRARIATPACMPPVPGVKSVGDPSEKLTKEQQERIEKRRQEALERRKRAQQAATLPRPPPATVIPYHPTENVPRQSPMTAKNVPRQRPSDSAAIHSTRHRPPHFQCTKTKSSVQQSSKRHRVVTPEHRPVTRPRVESEQMRHECFWDDLEAAAEIVQWEMDNMAEAALQHPSAKVDQCSNGERAAAEQNVLDLESNQHDDKPGKHGSSGIPSLSQELAAAAEIVQWELDHEGSAEVSGEYLRNYYLGSLGLQKAR